MSGHFPAQVLSALKDTMVLVFWRKVDMRQVLSSCEVPPTLISAQDWDQPKIRALDPIMDSLNLEPNGLAPLRRVLQETLRFEDADHLLRYEDGRRLKRDAERSLERLRLLVEKHDSIVKASSADEERKRASRKEEQAERRAFDERRRALQSRFLGLFAAQDAQRRGYDFQSLLTELFQLFDLQSRGAFRICGEQIDGAFIHEGMDFLLEAKWQAEPVTLADLRDLDQAVATKLDNTLGLFVAMNDFSREALEQYSRGSRPRVICMNGEDITFVLEGRIDLPDLLRRKRSIASQRGLVMVPAGAILKGHEQG